MMRGSLESRKPVSTPSCSLSEINAVLGISDVIDETATLAVYQGLPDLPGFDLLDCALSNLNNGLVELNPPLAELLYRHNGYISDFSLELLEEMLIELVGVLRDDIRKALQRNRLFPKEAVIGGWVGREPILRIKVQWSERSTYSTTAAYTNWNMSSNGFGL